MGDDDEDQAYRGQNLHSMLCRTRRRSPKRSGVVVHEMWEIVCGVCTRGLAVLRNMRVEVRSRFDVGALGASRCRYYHSG